MDIARPQDFDFASPHQIMYVKKHGHFNLCTPYYKKRIIVSALSGMLCTFVVVYVTLLDPMVSTLSVSKGIILSAVPVIVSILYFLRLLRRARFVEISTIYTREENFDLFSKFMFSEPKLILSHYLIQITGEQQIATKRRSMFLLIVDDNRILVNKIIVDNSIAPTR